MSTSPPLLLFLSRELDGDMFGKNPGQIEAWASRMAHNMEQQRGIHHMLSIAEALPMPSLPRHRQLVAELSVCTIPSKSLWPLRPSPRKPAEERHNQYFAAADRFLSKVLSAPGIDPLSKVLTGSLSSRLGSKKMPLALIAMHMGRPELLSACIDTLPDSYRLSAIQACARFSELQLAERLIDAWPTHDTLGKRLAQEEVWANMPLGSIVSTPSLPKTDPPRKWWRMVEGHQTMECAFNRVLADRPALKHEWVRAALCSGKLEFLLRLQVKGGIEDRLVWSHREGWSGPALAMVVSSQVSNDAEIDNPSALHKLRPVLSLINQMTPLPIKQNQAHQDWLDVFNWLQFQANPQIASPAQWQGSWGKMKDVALRWQDVMLEGANGAVALGAMAPIAKSCWAACDHDHEDPSIALDAYLEHFLPMARHLATMIPDHMPPGQAAALKEAGKLLLRPHAMKSQGMVPSNPNLALEGLLWRAAFSRLDARAKNGPGRLFPAAMHGARIYWDEAMILVKQGACPLWSQDDARVLHALVDADPKFPVQLRIMVEADALRSGRALAVTRPRRV